MVPRVSGLAARSPITLLAFPAARPLLASQAIGGRWLGGIGGVALTQRQLTLQIRDLLLSVSNLLLSVSNLFFCIRDLLIAFGNLPPQILDLLPQSIIVSL
jgi:hypothetical protein